MPEVLHAAERYYLRVCPVLTSKHCPGVVPVLERLKRRGVLLGLVTGNLTRIGWRKLERAGLRSTSASARSVRWRQIARRPRQMAIRQARDKGGSDATRRFR